MIKRTKTRFGSFNYIRIFHKFICKTYVFLSVFHKFMGETQVFLNVSHENDVV